MKKNPIIFMFSGQGSQYYQMGRMLYERNPVFRYWFDKGDAICRELNIPLRTEIYDTQHCKSKPFQRTLFTHPAVFIVEYALSQVLLSQDIIPDLVLGVSLGEFAAAAAANIISFDTALQLIISQANYLEQECTEGGMLAVLAPPQLYKELLILCDTSELAGINFNKHFVVAASQPAIVHIQRTLRNENISCQILPVEYAFHSSLIDKIATPYLQYLQNFHFSVPTLPFRSCVYPQQNLPFIPMSHFWDAARQPIQFMRAIECLEKEGPYTYLDVGPSGTLATFVKYNLFKDSSSQVKAIMTPLSEMGI